jgi:hypothetical protein
MPLMPPLPSAPERAHCKAGKDASCLAPPRIAAYSSGLRAGGIRPEQVSIMARVTGGDAALLAPIAADLVTCKVHLIGAVRPAAVRTAQAATTAIPVVANDLDCGEGEAPGIS